MDFFRNNPIYVFLRRQVLKYKQIEHALNFPFLVSVYEIKKMLHVFRCIYQVVDALQKEDRVALCCTLNILSNSYFSFQL